MLDEIRKYQELQKANILRAFGVNTEGEDVELEIFKSQETDIEKARSGIYKDNAINRKLSRVGQEYGKKLNIELSTEEQYKKNGKWTYYRTEKIHKPIIEKYLNKVKPSDTPTCTLIMGAPATGKGYLRKYLERENLHDFGDVVVDPDDIKTKELKGDYDKYSKHDVIKAAENVHEEGSYLAKEIISLISKRRGNFSIDKVFDDYDKLKNTIDSLVKLGYKVNLICTECDLDLAYNRMLERGKRTGRYVPENYFLRSHNQVNSTFEKIKDYKNLQNVIRYYTGEEPPIKKFTKSKE